MRFARGALAALLLGACPPTLAAAQDDVIPLPEPRLEAGRALMAVIADRQSQRSFAPRELSAQTLGELLWAAYGINRPQSGKRTAPSAHNRQEIDVYVSRPDGLYRYDAGDHALVRIHDRDVRALTGRQDFPADAPLNLVYVVDFSRMEGVPRADAIEAAAVATGAIAQNVYLYCASEGLATVVRGWVERDRLGEAMGLTADQRIMLAQTVGYPAP